MKQCTTKRYDTILFDLDGTILDTLGDLTDSMNYALSSLGFPKKDTFQVRSYVGNGIENAVEQATPGGRENPRFADCLHLFRTHLY